MTRLFVLILCCICSGCLEVRRPGKLIRIWGDKNTYHQPALVFEKQSHLPYPPEQVDHFRWMYNADLPAYSHSQSASPVSPTMISTNISTTPKIPERNQQLAPPPEEIERSPLPPLPLPDEFSPERPGKVPPAPEASLLPDTSTVSQNPVPHRRGLLFRFQSFRTEAKSHEIEDPIQPAGLTEHPIPLHTPTTLSEIR